MNWRKVLHVAVFEFRSNFRRFGYLFATFGLPLLGVLVLLVIQAVKGHPNVSKVVEGSVTKPVAIYDQAGLFPKDASLPKPFVLVNDLEKAKQAAKEGEYGALVVIPRDYADSHTITVYSVNGISAMGDVSDSVRPLLLYAQLSPKFSPEGAAQAIRPIKTNFVFLSKKEEQGAGRFFTGYALSILFFVALFTSTGYLLQSVAAEKENRVIEILLSSLTSMELLWGKVIGLAALGIAQVFVWIISIFALNKHFAVEVQGLSLSMKQLLHPDLQIVLAVLVVMPLSYLSYGLLMAGLGALGNNLRESQQFSGAVSFIAILPLMVNFVFVTNPNGAIARAFSYFPLTTPVALLMRMSAAIVPWWDFGIAVASLAIGALFSLWAGVRLFRVGVLMTGKKPSWKEVLRILRSPA